MSTRCLLIGGHGFVGRGIATAARARGWVVDIVSRQNYAAQKGAACDVLINANGNSRKYLATQDPALDFDLSVRSVQRTLTDFTAATYVFLSSIDVYNDVANPENNSEDKIIDPTRLSTYGFHKHLAEQIVQHHRSDALIIRMGGFVGPGLWKNPIYDLLTGAPLRVHPDSQFQYLHTEEFGRILLELVARNLQGQIINVAGDGLVSIRDIASMIPDCQLPDQENDLDLQRYEITIRKLNNQLSVPSSQQTIRSFLEDVAQGRSHLGKSDTAS